MAIKKGPTKGSGGKHRNKLKGYGPTPKAEDRVYHKAYKAKKAAERRQMADPRLAARRRVDKFASADTSDLVYGRNSVLEALRVGVPSSTLYIMSRIEHDDRTREIVKIAGMNGLHMLEADRLEMDRIARSGNHQGVILKVDPFQYSSLNELADRAEKKAKAMEAANSAGRPYCCATAVYRIGRRDRSAEPGCRDSFGGRIRCQWCDSAGTPFRFSERRRLEGVCRCGRAYAGGARGEPD